MQPHLTSVERCHVQLDKLARGRIQLREVEQSKIISVLLVTADALVVIDKITTAIQDQLLAVDLDGPRMMRGMPMYKIYSAVDEPARRRHSHGCSDPRRHDDGHQDVLMPN